VYKKFTLPRTQRKPLWPHETPMSATRARGLLLPAVASVFGELDINVSLWAGDVAWYPVHVGPSAISFEFAYGTETARWSYNARCMRRVVRTKKAVLGEHAGFQDLFVPVSDAGALWAVLVAGPFARARPTKSEVLERWRRMTGRHARVADPDFSQYLSTSLSMLTLGRNLFETFEALLECLARLVVGGPGLETMAGRADRLIRALDGARCAEKMWRATAEMVDERTLRTWMSVARTDALAAVGLARLPSHVVVALLLGRDDHSDPIDDILSRDAFQRACVSFAEERGGVACHRIGDHGVALLVDDPARGARTQSRLADLTARVASLATRFGLRLHAGVSLPDDAAALPGRYRSALAAAERALAQGLPVAHPERAASSAQSPLFALRRGLARAAAESPDRIPPLFDRYMDTVLVHSGYRLEIARAHLESGFDDMADALTSSGALDPKSEAELRRAIAESTAPATTIRELVQAWRPVILDLAQALERPSRARRERSLRRALAFVRDHLDEPLGLAKLARVAGFAPRHFVKLFTGSERRTPKRYVTELRVVRAKHLLATTALSVERVGGLSGIGTRASMHRVFREMVGMTPAAYRAKHAPERYDIALTQLRLTPAQHKGRVRRTKKPYTPRE
jgi:AraC-like DNA-binding protein/catechol 2,3-dioxygenase-like lactoylglutathione lyase family enzyme